MAEPGDNPRPFDVRTVRYLVRLMSLNDLSEIDLAEGEKRIRIRRSGTYRTVIAAHTDHAEGVSRERSLTVG